jgi:RNase P subunit RPR2
LDGLQEVYSAQEWDIVELSELYKATSEHQCVDFELVKKLNQIRFQHIATLMQLQSFREWAHKNGIKPLNDEYRLVTRVSGRQEIKRAICSNCSESFEQRGESARVECPFCNQRGTLSYTWCYLTTQGSESGGGS